MLMHFANDKNKKAAISKHIKRVGAENIYISTITLYELHAKLIKANVSIANVKALSDAIAIFSVKNFNSGAALSAAKVRVQLEELGKPSGIQTNN